MKHRFSQRVENLEAARRESRERDMPIWCVNSPEAIAAYRDRWKCEPIFMVDEGDEGI